MRSILDGYLTDECKTCPCWQDGSNGKGYGCGTTVPIDLCPAFKKMMEADKQYTEIEEEE